MCPTARVVNPGPMTTSLSAARPVPGVTSDDGVDLDVHVHGRHGPTVVLSHGFTEDAAEWSALVTALTGQARLVTWDQRGHGRSGWGDPAHATVDQTGRDLAAVIDAVAPHAPVVLVGHSMGGMSILALARQHPEWFGTRVVGALLVATSAGELVREGPLGLLHGSARALGLMPAVATVARFGAPLADRLPWRGSAVGRWATRRMLFTADTPDAEVRAAQARTESLPLDVGQAFGLSLLVHDEAAALPVLGRVPVTVVAGEGDRLTPATHGRRLTEALGPRARLVGVPGAGHTVHRTHPGVVDDALRDLVHRTFP